MPDFTDQLEKEYEKLSPERKAQIEAKRKELDAAEMKGIEEGDLSDYAMPMKGIFAKGMKRAAQEVGKRATVASSRTGMQRLREKGYKPGQGKSVDLSSSYAKAKPAPKMTEQGSGVKIQEAPTPTANAKSKLILRRKELGLE